MNNKDLYKNLCQKETSIPIFSQYWWLDAVVGEENWDVALVIKGGEIKASMPYILKKKYGFTLSTQPTLTQTLGPWIKESEAKYAKQLGQHKDLMQELIKQLPKIHHFSQNWHYTQTNHLPFYWMGFEQKTNYTYILPQLNDIDLIWNDIQGNIRREIKKAENRYKLKIRSDVSIDDFLVLNKKTFIRQGKTLPYTDDFVKKLDTACQNHNCRKIFIAEDENGKQHAGVYIVWNKQTTYYLMGGGDPMLRNSGATSLCMWEAIKYASTVSNTFDFEGSMLEPVERFVRGFGAKQTPYFNISKKSSLLIKLAYCAHSIRKSIR